VSPEHGAAAGLPPAAAIKFRHRVPFFTNKSGTHSANPFPARPEWAQARRPPRQNRPNENNMTQRLDARWRSEVTEALRTVEAQFGVAPQSLPRDALIAALTDAIWAQRAAYARVRRTVVACPELVDESM
jgi:hypothetical protein